MDYDNREDIERSNESNVVYWDVVAEEVENDSQAEYIQTDNSATPKQKLKFGEVVSILFLIVIVVFAVHNYFFVKPPSPPPRNYMQQPRVIWDPVKKRMEPLYPLGSPPLPRPDFWQTPSPEKKRQQAMWVGADTIRRSNANSSGKVVGYVGVGLLGTELWPIGMVLIGISLIWWKKKNKKAASSETGDTKTVDGGKK